MKQAIGFYPGPDLDTTDSAVVSHAGAVLLTDTIRAAGLGHRPVRGVVAVAASAGDP